MTRFLPALAVSIFAGLPAWADDPVKTVRGLLDAGDVTGLDLEMARLDEAVVAGGTAATLRAVNNRLFETTHPDRLAVIHRWAEAIPG